MSVGRAGRGLGALVAGALLASGLGVVRARPVPVGRYVELHYGVSSRHPWRTGQANERRTARVASHAPRTPPRKLWEASVGAGRVFSPAVAADGTVYVGSQSGVTAVGAGGDVLWSVRTGLVSGTPSFTPEGSLAVGVQPDELLVFGAGAVRSRARLGGGVWGSPLVLADGSIVVAAYDHAVHRIDPSGRRIFRTSVRTRIRGSVALSGELLVVPAGRELLWLTARGDLARAVSLGGEVVLGPAIADDGTAWVATADGVLSAVGPSGRLLVRTELGGHPSAASNLAIADDGSVRLGVLGAGLVCVGPNGGVRWRQSSHRGLIQELAVDSAGVTLTVAVDEVMLAVDEAGSVLWEVPLGASTDAAPVLGADGTIYVPTFGGTLQAWH